MHGIKILEISFKKMGLFQFSVEIEQLKFHGLLIKLVFREHGLQIYQNL